MDEPEGNVALSRLVGKLYLACKSNSNKLDCCIKNV